MRSVSAKAIDTSIQKAKSLSIVEEPFTIGDCNIVLQNLRPDHFIAVDKEVESLDGREYLYRYQAGQICRSIVEINGVDLRGVDFIECEEPDYKNPEKTKLIKIERHAWLLANVISTWSSDAILTVYRKFLDVTTKGEAKSKEGVQFVVTEETDEEKYRRLIGELKETEGNVPPLLVTKILEEYGYMLRSHLKIDDGKTEAPSTTPPSVQSSPSPVPPISSEPNHQGYDLAEAMRKRVPITQQNIMAPSEPVAAPVAVPVRSAPVYQTQSSVGTSNRSAQIAATMAEDPIGFEAEDLRASPPQAVIPPGMVGSPVLRPTPEDGSIPTTVLDRRSPPPTEDIRSIIDQPPSGTMNPKFKRIR